MKHIIDIRVYYEDTDCGGVVYYANYLKYFERARTGLLESGGGSLKKLMDEGIYFVVAAASLKYLRPGRYGDILSVETVVDKLGPASIVFGHIVRRGPEGETLVEATVRLGCVDRDMKPLRLPKGLTDALTHGAGL